MLIEGEKYACHACVRGHRVSNCRHADRPLLHINKKGRPTSQCTHCRTIRKSRKRNVRCDCDSEKAHAEGASTNDWASQAEDCCCNNSTHSVNTLRKDVLEPVTACNDNDTSYSPAPGNESYEDRVVTTHLKDGVTGFTNSYHIQMHKHNNTDHRCGLNLAHCTIVNMLGSESHTKDPTNSAGQEQRILESDHGSAFSSSASDIDPMSNLLPPLNLSNFGADCTYPQHQDSFSPIPDHEQPMFTEALSSVSIDWFDYDGFGSNNEHSPAPSSTGFDFAASIPIYSRENIDIGKDHRRAVDVLKS